MFVKHTWSMRIGQNKIFKSRKKIVETKQKWTPKQKLLRNIFCNKTGVLYLLYWRIIWFKLSIKGISLSYFFWWAPFGYQCFLSGVNEPGLSTRIDPGMALTPFPSSLGWYQIRTHDLLIVSLVCYLLDRTLALLSLVWLLWMLNI